jgi:hypothetical protein
VRVSNVSPPPADAGGPAPDTGLPDSAGTWTNGVVDAELAVGIGDADGADRAEPADAHGDGGNAMAAESAIRRDGGAERDTVPPDVARTLAKRTGVELAEDGEPPLFPRGLSRHGGVTVYVAELKHGAWGAAYRTADGRTSYWRSEGNLAAEERQMLLGALIAAEGLTPKANGNGTGASHPKAGGLATIKPVDQGDDDRDEDQPDDVVIEVKNEPGVSADGAAETTERAQNPTNGHGDEVAVPQDGRDILTPKHAGWLQKAMEKRGCGIGEHPPVFFISKETRFGHRFVFVADLDGVLCALFGNRAGVLGTWCAKGRIKEATKEQVARMRAELKALREKEAGTARQGEAPVETVRQNDAEDGASADDIEAEGAAKPAGQGDGADGAVQPEAVGRIEPEGDGAGLLLEDGRAALDGEVIPPEGTLFAEVNDLNDKLTAGLRNTVEMAVKLGEALIEAKAKCPHGTWLPTLKRYTRISARSASNYMRLAQAWPMFPAGNRQSIADLGVAGALADLNRRERDAREARPDPKKKPQEPAATTEEKVAPETERQQELAVPAGGPGPAIEASTATTTETTKPQGTAAVPSPSAKAPAAPPTDQPPSGAAPRISGDALFGEIVSLRKSSDYSVKLKELRELKSPRLSAGHLELLDAIVATEERFLQGLRDLREKVSLEAAEARP